MANTPTPDLPAGAVPLPPTKARPEGNWVVLRAAEELSGKDIKTILSAVQTRAGGEALTQMRDATMELVVENWSLDLPLPADSAITDRLPGNIYSALLKLIEPARRLAAGLDVTPTAPQSLKELEDQATPTTPSSE